MRAYSAVQCVGRVGEIGGRDCNFSKWLGQAQLQVLVDGFWKRWVSPVEQLGKELSAGGESQFQGAKVRGCLGKSRGGMETSVAREQWERGRGEEMEAKPSQRPESGQGLAHFFQGWIVYILNFAGHVISVITNQICIRKQPQKIFK